MPGLTSSSYGSGDQRWVGSAHGLREARSGYGLVAKFEDKITDGYIPSGTAVNAAVENDLEPWTGAAGEVLGFTVQNRHVPIGNDPGFTVAVLRHGIIDVDYLPEELPDTDIEGDVSSFTFVGGQADAETDGAF